MIYFLPQFFGTPIKLCDVKIKVRYGMDRMRVEYDKRFFKLKTYLSQVEKKSHIFYCYF